MAQTEIDQSEHEGGDIEAERRGPQEQGGGQTSTHAAEGEQPPGEEPPGAESPGEGGPEESTETVREPAKLMRLAYMIHQLLSEVREAELDEQTRTRLRAQVDQTASEAADVLSPDLGEELDRLRTQWSQDDGVSQSELRVEQAQLVGWLEGVLQGIQTAISAEQAAEQSELHQLSGGSQPG